MLRLFEALHSCRRHLHQAWAAHRHAGGLGVPSNVECGGVAVGGRCLPHLNARSCSYPPTHSPPIHRLSRTAVPASARPHASSGVRA